MYFLMCFMVLLRQLRRLYTSSFIFQVPLVYNYSTCRTNRVLTRSVRRVRVYAFGILTTRLRVQCTPKALTNQGEVRQYIDYVVYLNRIDSYYYPKEHIILHVFRAPGYDLLILLNWYQQPLSTSALLVYLDRLYLFLARERDRAFQVQSLLLLI